MLKFIGKLGLFGIITKSLIKEVLKKVLFEIFEDECHIKYVLEQKMDQVVDKTYNVLKNKVDKI